MVCIGVVQIYIYLCICLCTADNLTRQHDFTVKRLPDIASLCPYNQFCTSDPSKVIRNESFESCCEECSCKYDCHETGSCCFDAPTAGSTTLKYPCVYMYAVTRQIENLDLNYSYLLRFHIITNCSDNSREQEYPKCNQPTDIEDFVIVSDPQTGMVYRNKHCAKCNDVYRYESWIVNIACRGQNNIFHIDSLEGMERYWQENCSLLSYPPNGKAGRMAHCISNIVSECNTTGRWDSYDEDLLKACKENRESQNAVFRSRDLFAFDEKYIFYSSVYCYLCNVPKSTVRNDECKVIDRYSSNRRPGLIRIMGKLESQDVEAGMNDQDLLCKSFDVWDPFKKMCRQLICPNGKKPFNGRCIGLLSNIVGLSFVVNFEITFVDGPKADLISNLVNKIEFTVLSKIGKDLKCGKCSAKLFKHVNVTDTVYLTFDIFTTETCSDDVLLKRMRHLAGQERIYARLRENQNVANIELRLRFESFYGNKSFTSLAKMNYHLCQLSKMIDATIFLQCSHILITKVEADVLGYHYDTTSLPGNNTDVDSVPICLDTYFSKYRSRSTNSGATSTFVKSLNYWILCLLISERVKAFTSISV